MKARHDGHRRRTVRRILTGTAIGAVAITATSMTASAATTASFSNGVLAVIGDNLDNSIAISRDATGRILVNGGAVTITGGSPTVANTALIQVFGLGGTDVITLNEANGALPRANLFGSTGNDTLDGGSGADQLFGQGGNDTLHGRGGFDLLFGGSDNDTITGGDADDQAFGEGGNDRMVWNPGDDTDLNEGGSGVDTVEVNGGNGAEQFTATANGARVRFDRINPAPFSIDIGTSENLAVNANGGDDFFAATGNLAALTAITADGGAGNDTLLGGNGADTFVGRDGNDFVDGNQGNDVAFLGAGDDSIQWDPGDGNDIVEGQDGIDVMAFNGSAGDEIFDAAANGPRVRFTRNLGNIVIDLDDVEFVVAKALDGADNLVVNDLSGTDVINVVADLNSSAGGDDAAADNVNVNATSGDDAVIVDGAGPNAQVIGLRTLVSVSGAAVGSDRVTVNAGAGADIVDASGLSATSALLTVDGGEGDDVVVGGQGDDILLGGAGDDVLIGGPGNDNIDGGPGDNVVLDAFGVDGVTSAAAAGADWVPTHAHTVDGNTVLDLGERQVTLPRADITDLVQDAPSS